MLAVCPFCNMKASDFNYCMRCKQKLPDNIEMKPKCSVITIQKENTAIGNSSKNIVPVGDDFNANDRT